MIEIVKKYSDFYVDKNNSFVADMILESENVELSHRTLRKYVGDYRKSLETNSWSEECCGNPMDCDSSCMNRAAYEQPKYEENSWNKENTVDYFSKLDTPKMYQESNKNKVLQPYLGGDKNNVLVCGDIHAPFTRSGYLEHCLETQKKFNCGTVIFIGDILDSAYSSFHPTSPDGYAAGEELDRAVDVIKEWYRVFPVAKVCLGNHDLIAMRKAFANGLSSRWIRGLDEVLQTPNWTYELEFEIDGVLYTHGTGSSGQNAAYNRALNWGKPVVQGHLHTESSIRYNVSSKDRIFGMQVGCGIDDNSYAFSYAKGNARKSVISCGVVLDSGKLPILSPMEL